MNLNDLPIREKPLWWHLKGLSQTASGYGNKLTTTKQVFVENRWRRIYVTIWSNVGTSWILVNGEKKVIH